MKHAGTDYVGIGDRFENEFAPRETGIWRMDLDSGKSALIFTVEQAARLIYPNARPDSGCLYIFREGFNPSGTRFIAFVKESRAEITKGYSMRPDGSDVRYFFDEPSHHSWRDNRRILDWGRHIPPGGTEIVRGYYLFDDDGSGKPKESLWECPYNGHDSYIPDHRGDWMLTDTYGVGGLQHLFLYHLPTRSFIPLARLKNNAKSGMHRVDLHPRFSPDLRTVSIDATFEGLGRQIYLLDIGDILANPPRKPAG